MKTVCLLLFAVMIGCAVHGFSVDRISKSNLADKNLGFNFASSHQSGHQSGHENGANLNAASNNNVDRPNFNSTKLPKDLQEPEKKYNSFFRKLHQAFSVCSGGRQDSDSYRSTETDDKGKNIENLNNEQPGLYNDHDSGNNSYQISQELKDKIKDMCPEFKKIYKQIKGLNHSECYQKIENVDACKNNEACNKIKAFSKYASCIMKKVNITQEYKDKETSLHELIKKEISNYRKHIGDDKLDGHGNGKTYGDDKLDGHGNGKTYAPKTKDEIDVNEAFNSSSPSLEQSE